MSTSQTITPLLAYEDIEAAHDFLVAAFDFAPGRLDRDGDGHVVHGEVESGNGSIWLHRVSDEHALAPPGPAGTAGGGIVVTVDDVDAHHERARAAGARIDSPPVDRFYGRREYGARDPEGHRWWIGTPIS